MGYESHDPGGCKYTLEMANAIFKKAVEEGDQVMMVAAGRIWLQEVEKLSPYGPRAFNRCEKNLRKEIEASWTKV